MIAAAGCSGQNTVPPSGSSAAREEDSGTGGTKAGETAAAESLRCKAVVTLEGGSGKASVESPCPVFERDGELFALITWSSSYYDYMIVNGEKILPVNTEGNSQFEIPLEDAAKESSEEGSGLPTDCVIDVQADTTAMSEAHLIDYRLSFSFFEEDGAGPSAESAGSTESGTTEDSGAAAELTEEGPEEGGGTHQPGDAPAPVLSGYDLMGRDENEYAGCFAIYRYEGGYSVLSVDDGRNYLIVPEGEDVPEAFTTDEAGGKGELIVLQLPLDHIYLAASAVMCQLDAIGAVQNVTLSGLPRESWYIEAARDAMDNGTLQYGGKYSEPDYEKILAMDTDLAIESTMIHHTPKVKEKLEKLRIPVLIDRSSYESEPLGRAEWVKAYGLLTGREEEAKRAFGEQKGFAEEISAKAQTGGDSGKDSSTGAGGSPETAQPVSVAIFSVNSNRQVVTRTPGDYFARMLETAGGRLCTPETDSGRATQTVSMESFYAAAEDADILIYNASIEDAPESLAQMCGKDSILTAFRAVREGNVWCMRSSLYQNASRTGAIMRDLNAIVTGEAEDETEFFFRLK